MVRINAKASANLKKEHLVGTDKEEKNRKEYTL